jgi:hypothetical protein
MTRKKTATKESFESGNGSSNFIALYFDMIDSKAWQELTAHDIQLYIYLRRKYTRKVTNGQIWDSNKDNISAPEFTTIDKNGKEHKGYTEFMTKRTFWKSMDHLIDLGFIRLIENRYATRQCNIYGFSDMWQKYGTKDFYIKPEYRRTLKQQLNSK